MFTFDIDDGNHGYIKKFESFDELLEHIGSNKGKLNQHIIHGSDGKKAKPFDNYTRREYENFYWRAHYEARAKR